MIAIPRTLFPRATVRCGRGHVKTALDRCMSSRIYSSTIIQRPSTTEDNSAAPEPTDIATLLSKPTWDPSTLLPPSDLSSLPRPSSSQLHHLLRLSALPPPRDADHEKELLDTLAAQLHFVRQIQSVDTAGVEPLRAIRDETKAGVAEVEINADRMKGALGREEVRGRYAPRIRRRKESVAAQESGEGDAGEKWDVLGNAARRVGRYFVVERKKGR